MTLSQNQQGIIIASACAVALLIIIFTLVFSRDRVCLPFSRFAHRSSSISTELNCTPLRVYDMESQHPQDIIEMSDNASSQVAENEYEKYGELYVSPTQKPVGVALDIMTRMVMCFGLPASATPISPSPASSSYPISRRLSLNLPRSDSLTPSEQVSVLMGFGNSVVGQRSDDSPTPNSDGTLFSVDINSPVRQKGREFLGVVNSAAATNSKTQAPQISSDVVFAQKVERMRKGEWATVASEDLRRCHEDDIMVDPMSYTFGSGKTMAVLYR